MASTHLFSYRPPWVELVDPPHAPADGCHKWESIAQDNRGVDTQSSLGGLDGLRRRACCQPALVRVSGRDEGVEERFLDAEVDEGWSIGDDVLSGGELAAMVLIDAHIESLIPTPRSRSSKIHFVRLTQIDRLHAVQKFIPCRLLNATVH